MGSLLRAAALLSLLAASATGEAALFPVAVESATRRTAAGDTIVASDVVTAFGTP